MSKIFAGCALILLVVSGCASTELSQVSSMSPERAINTPEQATRLVKEHE